MFWIKPYIAAGETPSISEDIQGDEYPIFPGDFDTPSDIETAKRLIIDDFVRSFETRTGNTRFPRSLHKDDIKLKEIKIRRIRRLKPVPEKRIVRSWSRSDVRALKSLYRRRDRRVKDISGKLGRSETAIRIKAHRLRIKKARA